MRRRSTNQRSSLAYDGCLGMPCHCYAAGGIQTIHRHDRASDAPVWHQRHGAGTVHCE